MANTNSINKLQAAIVEALKQHLNNVSVSVYAGEFTAVAASKTLIKTPAVWIDFAEGSQDISPGTEQLDIECQFTAYAITQVVNDPKRRNQDAQALAQQIAVHINNNQFGMTGVSLPSPIKIKPAASPYFIKNSLGVCVVRWMQTIRLGDSVWDSDDVVPTEVWLGFAPEIGIPHIEDYFQVAP